MPVSKSFAIVAVATLSLIGLASQAQAAVAPVNSLNDLPTEWEGVAGGLVTQVPARLVIKKIKSVSRKDGQDMFTADYQVDAVFSVGERQLAVNQVRLSGLTDTPRVRELTLSFDDELVATAFASVTYDEATDTYSLKDHFRQTGERRFSLRGKASR